MWRQVPLPPLACQGIGPTVQRNGTRLMRNVPPSWNLTAGCRGPKRNNGLPGKYWREPGRGLHPHEMGLNRSETSPNRAFSVPNHLRFGQRQRARSRPRLQGAKHICLRQGSFDVSAPMAETTMAAFGGPKKRACARARECMVGESASGDLCADDNAHTPSGIPASPSAQVPTQEVVRQGQSTAQAIDDSPPPSHGGFSAGIAPPERRQTPLRAVRANCLWCCLGSRHEVRLCPATECPSWSLRMGKAVKGHAPLKIIRKRCLDCRGYEPGEVRKCSIQYCVLWPFRFGRKPAALHRREEDS